MQDLVVAAWLTKGDVMTKLNTALELMDPTDDDYEGFARITA